MPPFPGREYVAGPEAVVDVPVREVGKKEWQRVTNPPRVSGAPWLFGDADLSLCQPNLRTATRQDLLTYLENTWALYETLFRSIKEEALFVIANPLRRPLIFYLCHTAVLYINKMHLAKLCDRINPHFENIFQTGVDEMSWDDMDLNNYDWPSAAEVWDYRRKTFETLENVILNHPAYKLPITMDDPFWAVVMGFEHDRIHLETSAVLIRELPLKYVAKPLSWRYGPNNADRPQDAPKNEMIEVPEGIVDIGKPRDFPTYGWDNEYGRKLVAVPAFKAAKFLVTNAEFLAFVEAGGYKERRLWDEEGWRWVTYKKAEHPVFWVRRDDGGYAYRATYDVIEMPWSWPVDVNCLEAKAFCRWKGPEYRLVSEAEHHRMRDPVPDGLKPKVERDIQFRPEVPGNLNMRWHSATPVDMYPRTSQGFHDAHGNVWEWTEDWFHPLPGFQIHPLYDDFSTPCFDNRHNMIMGGSWVSTGDEASSFARFHFRRHFFQNLGFRYCVGPEPKQSATLQQSVYESGKSLAEYLLFHFGRREEVVAIEAPVDFALEFPRRCAEECIAALRAARGPGAGLAEATALDVGCAVGRSTFELARHVRSALGVDFSARFIAAADRLRERGWEEYPRTEEGAIEVPARAEVDPAIDRARVKFAQGDACNLPATLPAYDVVLAANLIDRLHHPLDFLNRLPDLVKPGGVAVITSPYTWLEEFTQREFWLGGKEEGRGTAEGLREAMRERGFAPLFEKDLPFLIREHRRKYQLSFAHCTAWKRVPASQ
eukprot:tig00000889_g5332.t1